MQTEANLKQSILSKLDEKEVIETLKDYHNLEKEQIAYNPELTELEKARADISMDSEALAIEFGPQIEKISLEILQENPTLSKSWVEMLLFERVSLLQDGIL